MAKPTANELWRIARTPRALVRALLGLVLIVGFAFLGSWQWERTQDVLEMERAELAQPAAVDGLNPLGVSITAETVGRRVTATGTYVAADQRIVAGRILAGQEGVWVVTPLRLADASLIAVMRGWLPSDQAPGVLPMSGQVRITGVLQADESFYAGAPTSSGPIAAISVGSLQWGSDARSGFIVLQSQDPHTGPAPTTVPVIATSGEAPFPLQNFVYAIQWWVFALFIIGVYARWIWMDAVHLEDDSEATRVD